MKLPLHITSFNIVPALLPITLIACLSACQQNSQTIDNSQSNNDGNGSENTTTDHEHNNTNEETTETASIILDFPNTLSDIPYLLHPLVLRNKDETGIQSFKGKGSYKDGYDNLHYFYETSPYNYDTRMSNLIFEDLQTNTVNKL